MTGQKQIWVIFFVVAVIGCCAWLITHLVNWETLKKKKKHLSYQLRENMMKLTTSACNTWLVVCQVYGVLPSTLQHQFRLLFWEECQLLWLGGGCSESCSSSTQSQDHHHPHQPSGQSVLLVPGILSHLLVSPANPCTPYVESLSGIIVDFTVCSTESLSLILLVHLLTAPKSPWWPSGVKILLSWSHHCRPRCPGQTTGSAESLSGAGLVCHPPGALAQLLPSQPGMMVGFQYTFWSTVVFKCGI